MKIQSENILEQAIIEKYGFRPEQAEFHVEVFFDDLRDLVLDYGNNKEQLTKEALTLLEASLGLGCEYLDCFMDDLTVA